MKHQACHKSYGEFFFISSEPAYVDCWCCTGCTRNGQQVTCGPSSLNSGASASYTIRVNSLVAGTFNNAAIVRAGPVGATVEQGPVSATVTVQRTCARFVVSSTTNAVQPYDCGADFRFNQANAASTSPAQGTCCVSAVQIQPVQIVLILPVCRMPLFTFPEAL